MHPFRFSPVSTFHVPDICVGVRRTSLVPVIKWQSVVRILPPPSEVTVEQLLQLPPSSRLYTAIMGLVAEKITMTSTPVTLRSSTGKYIYT
jgi:hypothetical protein